MHHRIFAATVHARFSRTRNIPAYEIPLFQISWPGSVFEDPVPLPTTWASSDKPEQEFERLKAEYGFERMQATYPSWIALQREMQISAKETEKWLKEEASAEERERVRQENERAAVEQANHEQQEQEAEDRKEAYRLRIKEEAKAKLEAEREAEEEDKYREEAGEDPAAATPAPKKPRGRPAKAATVAADG